jgi:tRNA A-37 threonylcarbamoyl transferase component Bud32
MLVEKSVDGINSLTVRKIAWDSAGSKTLRNQYIEISSRMNSANFPAVEKILDVSNCFVYDMTYFKDDITLADQIQISPQIEELVTKVLDTYVRSFPRIDKSQSGSKIFEYIEKKIVPVQLTHISGQLQQVVNEINQEVSKLRFTAEKYDFHPDTYLVHGDLSLGNIMIAEGEVVHFIDLLRQEVGRSRSIDLGKLLFSLRSGYENFDPNRDAFLVGDKLTLKSTSTRASFIAEGAFKKYVDSNLAVGMWAEIELHAKVHALRIIPYKIKYDEKNQLAWMIFTLNYLIHY